MHPHLVRVVQNLDVLALDVHLTLEDEVVLFVVDALLDAKDDGLVDVELLHPLKMRMDYFQRVVDVALQRMDSLQLVVG